MMDHIEIDNVEVTDSLIEVTYWIPGVSDIQQLAFKLSSFEKWLMSNRSTSISSYWDHWDTMVLNEMKSVILYQDIKQYLWYRFEMLKPHPEKVTTNYMDRKPMTRVSRNKRGTADSESA